MINILDKNKCSGCTACYCVCPVEAIKMQEDLEGFLYPIIDNEKCIECNKCEQICPIINPKKQKSDLQICFAAKNKNEDDRMISSSGGMFIAFARAILHSNGIVFGSELNKELLAYHAVAENVNELYKLVGSKYMQSVLGNTFINIKSQLENGKIVLFSGTTCQVGGLKAFLNKEYTNLICIDFICLGVPSPKIWADYIKTYFDYKNIKNINFKDKTNGWHKFSLNIKYDGNRKDYIKIGSKTLYFSGYFKGLYSRPSCGECIYKSDVNRISDITIADCWGSGHIAPELDDNKGLSSIICHSDKGLAFFDSIKKDLICKNSKIEDIKNYNSGYYKSRNPSELRSSFWNDYTKLPFKKLFHKYCKPQKSSIFLRVLRKAQRVFFN